jgi:hypothetical protein
MNYRFQTGSQTNLLSSGKFWILTFVLIINYSSLLFSQTTVYIDPANSGDPGQNGSIDHPYDSWSDFSIASNNTYLMKKGTSVTNSATISVVSKNNVTISTYGTGIRPTITYTGGQCCINGDGSSNFLIEGYKLVNGPAGVVSFGAHAGRSASFQTIRDCEVVGGWRGINSEVWETETGNISDLLIEDCIVHGSSTDGIFAKSRTNATYNNITIRGTHVYDVNQKWLELQNGSCDGDCIHLLRAGGVLIEDNILDRRGTSYKFSIIVIGRTDTESATIRNNTIYPPNQHPTWSSNAFYFQILGEVNFIGNRIIGSQMPPGQSSTAGGIFRCKVANVSYNLFDNIGVVVAAGAPTPYTHQYNNNVVRFYLQGNETYFLSSGNQPMYLRNNIFMMPTGTYLVNDGMNGGVNVFMTNNVELYSNDLSYFDNIVHFANITGGDFHLTANSTIARNQGVEYTGAWNFDLDSTAVPQEAIRDIGAFEYNSGGGSTNNPPVIANQVFTVPENSVTNTTIGTVIATDPDPGQSLTYSILSGNTGNAFQIVFTTGVLKVATQAALNFEANPTFALVVRVTDNGAGTLSSQATMTINLTNVNEPPTVSPQSFSIAENSAAGTTVGTVAATDPDAGQSLTYSILSGNTGNAFQITSTTGVLKVATQSALNFEVTPSYSLVVKVQDNGTGSLSSQATMTIVLTNVNESPLISNQSFTVPVTPPAGTVVGTVVATDPDAGQTLTYSIVSGNTGNAFQVNAASGILSVLTPSALVVNTTFALVVKVQDNGAGNLWSQATMTVTVSNINQNPVIVNQSFSVAENSVSGTVVGTVIASDPDAGQLLTYSILSGNTGNAFQIISSTGVLKVATPSAINFEVNPTFALIVKVQDNGAGSLSSQATMTINLINVNENPVIGNQTFAVLENSPTGTIVGSVVASDPDLGQTLTYSIQNGNSFNAFQINNISGVITVKNVRFINYEFIPVFHLAVRVMDNGAGNLWSQAVITIQILDIIGKGNEGGDENSLKDGSEQLLENLSFNLFPNPVIDYLNVEFESSGNEDVKISIISLSGQIVFSKNYKGSDGRLSEKIDLIHLQKGFYIVSVLSQGVQKTQKFIKL